MGCCPNFLDNYDLLKGNRLGTGILLSESACGLWSEIQRQLLIVDALQRRWSLEGIVEPSHQVAVDEQLMSYQRHEVGEAPGKGAAHLQVLQQEHGDQRRPDLDLHGVLACTDKRLDLERLLEGLKKQFD